MSEVALTCPRCSDVVGELCFVPPDLLTRTVIEEVESDEQDLTDDAGMEVCGDCLADLNGH
jgi:hypothetical protein